MKKALVILMALSMVFAAFADEPAVKNEIAEFKGNATVTWGVDLDAKDSTKSTGFKNAEEASFKFTLVEGGTKSTTGEGVWGDIQVKLGNDDNPNIVIKNSGVVATDVSVASAKLHITDMIAIGIRKGDVTNGGYQLALAADSNQDTFNVGKFGGTAHKDADNTAGTAAVPGTTQGITLEVALPGLLNLNIDFRSEQKNYNGDNGKTGDDFKETAVCGDEAKVYYSDNYGFAADVDVKAVENLTLKAGYGMDFYGDKAKGIFAQAAYKLALDDTMFIQPQVAFGTNLDKTHKLAIGLLFGWGDTNQDPIKYMNKKVSNGFSVATLLDLSERAPNVDMAVPLCVAVYDSTFVENLKAGVEFHIADLTTNTTLNNDNNKMFAFDLAFDTKYTLGDIVPTFALKFSKAAKTTTAAAKDTFKVYAACDYKAIANTTFTLGYESGNLLNKKANGNADAKIGQLWVSAKISF